MAIVPNKDGGPNYNDKRLSTPNRNNAGTPVGALTPLYQGEIVLDTTNGILYVMTGTTNNDWMPVTRTM